MAYANVETCIRIASKIEQLSHSYFRYGNPVRWRLAIFKLFATNLCRLLHDIPFQVSSMGLGEVLSLRHAVDSYPPKHLGPVVDIDPSMSIFRPTDVEDWLATILILAEQKVNFWHE
jgi:hypothetical protein